MPMIVRGERMSVFSEALELLGLAGGSARYRRGQESAMARTRQEQRELAETMRALPGRFADRLSVRTLQQVTVAAAAGRWEEAVEELIIALHVRAEMVTRAEREELSAVLEALNMPREHLDVLLLQG
jgi:hypothetical protein